MSEHTAVPHSPLPWNADVDGTVAGGCYILDANDRLIGEIFPVDGQEGEDLSAGNAAILVRAVNAHEALVKALLGMLTLLMNLQTVTAGSQTAVTSKWIEGNQLCQDARAALKKAGVL